ncbi:zinc ribbon domain-containing protein [Halopiger goleimassiliensis]|uniref:zinc ribbon domain-containing protein n=1 Tax=Halopiger goleimassiliensis TaxID=1293048 RepID=UPI000A4A273F|nr:zinc ribbon domain-containing protein [Halopiger goleimassiliensis]
MGFFENLGRKVGEFTHEAKQAADEEATHACENCGARFYTAREECPDCGSPSIFALEDASEDGTDAGEGSDLEAARDESEGTDAAADGTGDAAVESPAGERGESADGDDTDALIDDPESDASADRNRD